MTELTKTTVYLLDADYRRVRAIARKQNRKTAQIVRDAIAEYVRRHDASTKPRSLGAGLSGRGDVSERSEELLSGMGRRR